MRRPINVASISRRFVDSSATFLGRQFLRRQAHRRHRRVERAELLQAVARLRRRWNFTFGQWPHTSGRSDVEHE